MHGAFFCIASIPRRLAEDDASQCGKHLRIDGGCLHRVSGSSAASALHFVGALVGTNTGRRG
jgi:hypothetical protein